MSPSRRRAIGAVRGLASRAPRRAPLPRSTLVSRCGRARCLAATARGGSPPSRLAPPLHPRGALAYYPGGAIGTSRPTAITPANFAYVLSARCDARLGILRSTPVRHFPAPPLPLAPYRHYTREWHPAPSLVPRCVRPRRAPLPCPVVRPIAVGRNAWPPGLPARAHCPQRRVPHFDR